MQKFLYFVLLLSVCFSAMAKPSKSEKRKAANIGKIALTYINCKDYERAKKNLLLAQKIDPSTFVYPYEIGYTYTQTKDYETAIKYFEQACKCDDATDQCFIMLGNAYFINNEKEKAQNSYQSGLKKFPESGALYFALGNSNQDDMLVALNYYEKGVSVEPTYSSNYYWLTKIFYNTTEKIWALLYGEIFVNLEKDSKRSVEIKKIIYDTYKESISYSGDTLKLNFFNNNFTYKNEKKIKLLPVSMIFDPCMEKSVKVGETINLKSLNRIRTNFITNYYSENYNISHPCILYEWHKKMIDEGVFESYNYWLLGEGDGADFAIWQAYKNDEYENFLIWLKNNSMNISKSNKFHRFDY